MTFQARMQAIKLQKEQEEREERARKVRVGTFPIWQPCSLPNKAVSMLTILGKRTRDDGWWNGWWRGSWSRRERLVWMFVFHFVSVHAGRHAESCVVQMIALITDHNQIFPISLPTELIFDITLFSPHPSGWGPGYGQFTSGGGQLRPVFQLSFFFCVHVHYPPPEDINPRVLSANRVDLGFFFFFVSSIFPFYPPPPRIPSHYLFITKILFTQWDGGTPCWILCKMTEHSFTTSKHLTETTFIPNFEHCNKTPPPPPIKTLVSDPSQSQRYFAIRGQ